MTKMIEATTSHHITKTPNTTVASNPHTKHRGNSRSTTTKTITGKIHFSPNKDNQLTHKAEVSNLTTEEPRPRSLLISAATDGTIRLKEAIRAIGADNIITTSRSIWTWTINRRGRRRGPIIWMMKTQAMTEADLSLWLRSREIIIWIHRIIRKTSQLDPSSKEEPLRQHRECLRQQELLNQWAVPRLRFKNLMIVVRVSRFLNMIKHPKINTIRCPYPWVCPERKMTSLSTPTSQTTLVMTLGTKSMISVRATKTISQRREIWWLRMLVPMITKTVMQNHNNNLALTASLKWRCKSKNRWLIPRPIKKRRAKLRCIKTSTTRLWSLKILAAITIEFPPTKWTHSTRIRKVGILCRIEMTKATKSPCVK